MSVGRIVLDAIPWTLGLVGLTTILAFILGTGIGILGAWRRGGRLDSIMPPIFVIMTVIPYFWIGLILILVFGVKLHWLPYFFTYNITLTPGLNLAFIGNVLQHLTGSKQHNVALRDFAVRRGLHISEYGVLDDSDEVTQLLVLPESFLVVHLQLAVFNI